MAGVHRALEPRAGHVRTGARFSLRLLRQFDLTDHLDRSISLPSPAQRVLAFLAVHDCPLQRAFVAGSLWPDSSEAKAYGSLRSALWRLSAAAPGAVVASPTMLQLGQGVSIDLIELLATTRELRSGGRVSRARRTSELAAQFEDELLTDWYDEWVAVWRERWRQARLHALEALARGLALAGEFDAAVECGLAAVVADPLRETSHRVLIEIHLLEGNRSEALREYDAFRALLARELGLEPDRELTDLVRPLIDRTPSGDPVRRGRDEPVLTSVGSPH